MLFLTTHFLHSLSEFLSLFFFFFNDTATTEIYTLSLHDALPICTATALPASSAPTKPLAMNQLMSLRARECTSAGPRSEEHTSELHSRQYLVCRLLLEKKKKI